MLRDTHRPRNVDAKRAGAILYGDWGTSKAYVIGLAFALAGYSSFWLILAVSILSVLIGINYIVICKYYPNGGGVYASVRHRSPMISMIGAFFIIADYLVTAALSALSASFYFGITDPLLLASLMILAVGLLNYFGPKHTGTYAFGLVVLGFTVLTILAFFSLPFLKEAWLNIKPLSGTPLHIWKNFVGVIVALSGVEAIANTTGVMKLNPNSSLSHPSVTKTSTKAILFVMIEVAVFTCLFGFVVASFPNFELVGDTVNAPGNPDVRDYMLKFMANNFIGSFFGPQIGSIFSWVVSIVIGLLLISAVNTAINGFVALQYVMGGDHEVPKSFQKLNNFGVPILPLILATIVPIFLVVVIRDVAGLASLYAIGFVGAIATNLGSTSTDFHLDLKKWERSLMFFSFLIMAAVEITLFIDKPHARNYVLIIVLIGLLLRGLAKEFKLKKIMQERPRVETRPLPTKHHEVPTCILCYARRPSRALAMAIEKSKKLNLPLHVLYIKEQNVISDEDMLKTWEEDEEATRVYYFVKKRAEAGTSHFHYYISDSKVDLIASYVMALDATEVFMSLPTKGTFYQMVKGDLVRELSKLIPEEVNLYIIP